MTEEEWLACTDLPRLIKFQRLKARPRKLRLFACACARRLWGILADGPSRTAIEVAERFADGEADEAELTAAYRESLHVWVDAQHQLSALVSSGMGAVMDDARYAALVISTHAPQVCVSPDAPDRRKALGVQRACQRALFDCVFGNPFRPASFDSACRTPTVVSLARAAYDERLLPGGELDPHRLAVLADALEEAGASDEVVAHLRSPGPHVRGCWAVDLCLGLR
jgi:hypothetical protein